MDWLGRWLVPVVDSDELCCLQPLARNSRGQAEFVTTGARLYINHAGQPPPESVDITWGNTRKRSALRGAATLFTASEDGNRHEKFGVSEISDGATIVPTFGIGHVTIPVEMSKFLGRLLVCVKYYDETNHSCRQTFSFNEVRQLTMMF